MPHWLGRTLSITLRAAAVLLLGVTFLPLISTDEWWIRVMEFPRVQLVVLLSVVMAGFALWERRSSWIWLAIAVAAFGYQLYRIWPYTPLHPPQAVMAKNCPAARQIRLVSANVLQTNDHYDEVIAMVRRQQPDIFVGLETGTAWAEALAPITDQLPYTHLIPLNNTYGMTLYSRLPLTDLSERYTVEPDIPSIKTDVSLPSGDKVELLILHPRPPVPGKDSGTRDAELVLSAAEVRDAERPIIVFGDLNDVAWSPTTQMFQEIAGVLDPRVGRGFYATFNARMPLLRWPLDHVFFSEEFTLIDFEVLDYVGSDHFPVMAELCLAPAAGEILQQAPDIDAETVEDASEQLEEGLQQQQREAALGADETDTPQPD